MFSTQMPELKTSKIVFDSLTLSWVAELVCVIPAFLFLEMEFAVLHSIYLHVYKVRRILYIIYSAIICSLLVCVVSCICRLTYVIIWLVISFSLLDA